MHGPVDFPAGGRKAFDARAHGPVCAPVVRACACALALATLAACAAPANGAWAVAGHQGLVQMVIVPMDVARDREAYTRQIERLCHPDQTCFVNFYTNSKGAPVSLPLADAIDHEPAAVYRRSMKRGAATFTWSCRLQVANEPCF